MAKSPAAAPFIYHSYMSLTVHAGGWLAIDDGHHTFLDCILLMTPVPTSTGQVLNT